MFSLGKGSLFCFASGQIVHKGRSKLEKDTSSTIELSNCDLDDEGWPSLLCHRTNFETIQTLLQTETILEAELE